MKIKEMRLTLLLILLLGVFLPLSSCNDSEGQATSDQPITSSESQFTPIVSSLLTKPNPVLGSDGRYHFVYELKVTNATGLTWIINSLEIVEGNSPTNIFATFSGDEITKKMEILGTGSLTNQLEPSQSALIFLTFSVESIENIPSSLNHILKITVPGGIPEGFANFVGLAPGEEQLVETGGITEVGSADAIVIGPPVEGSGWIAADGCCTAVRHIRAFLPINGKLFISQRFAIDWEMLNGDNRIFVGDPLDVNSYFCYGQKALAVADANVITVLDGLNDQIPGALPSDITLKEADGNHVVLDLGNGRFALYAHLIPNSIIVKEGDSVKRGQVLGLVGNSGNTSEPHLHFHVMSSPSAFGSNGLPYVIDEFDLLGRAPSTEAFDKAALEGTPLEILPVNNPGIHKDELPLDLRIVAFPSVGN